MPARIIKRTAPILIKWLNFPKRRFNFESFDGAKDLVQKFSKFYYGFCNYIVMFLRLPK